MGIRFRISPRSRPLLITIILVVCNALGPLEPPQRPPDAGPVGAAGPKSDRKSEISADPECRLALDVKIELELFVSRRMQKTAVEKLERLEHGACSNQRGRGVRRAPFGVFFTTTTTTTTSY